METKKPKSVFSLNFLKSWKQKKEDDHIDGQEDLYETQSAIETNIKVPKNQNYKLIQQHLGNLKAGVPNILESDAGSFPVVGARAINSLQATPLNQNI